MIDGFDPDKFRKVNKDSKKNNNYDSGIHVERQFNSSASSTGSSSRGATEIPSMQMPGVPSYDNSERQLLASLEQELGVLWTKQINLPIKMWKKYFKIPKICLDKYHYYYFEAKNIRNKQKNSNRKGQNA